MNKHIFSTTLTVACLAFSSVSFSNDEPVEVMVTTATRTPTPISEVLSVSTVITREDIDLYQSSDVLELLSREAGVSFIRNGSRGSATSLLLRGNQDDHTMFLVDGIRIGSATLGSASIASLNLDLIERVEIIRGPKSALYGADAIGGVINLISRTSASDSGNIPLSTELSYGSNNTKEFTAVGGLQAENYNFTAVLGLFDTDGIDSTSSTSGVNGDRDGYENNSLALNYGQQINDDLDFRLSYNRNEGTNEYDSACSEALTYAPVDCQIYADTLNDTFAGSVNYDINSLYRTTLQAGISRDESEQLADIDLSGTNNGGVFNTEKKEATWINFVELSEDHSITAGFDYLLDEIDGTTNYDATSRDNKAGFVQLESSFDAFSFNLGLRHDDNEQFGDHTTASVQAGYQVGDTRFIASYAEGFKAPTFNDLYFPFFGNPTFVPEESKNKEIAMQRNGERTNFYAAFYRNDIENLIQYNSATFETDQIAQAEITGFEFDIDVFLANWRIGIAGDIIEPENSANGNLLRRRAEQSLSADLDSQFGNFSYGLSLRTESHRFNDPANTVRLGGYALADVRAEYRLSEEWQLKMHVNNITDKEYATANSFSLGSYQNIGREAFFSVAYTPKF